MHVGAPPRLRVFAFTCGFGGGISSALALDRTARQDGSSCPAAGQARPRCCLAGRLQGAPMAGFYADGEIGPSGRRGAPCRVRWAGGGGNEPASELQGFTTIVSVLGCP